MDDETGVPGTGVVAWGVEWPDQSVSMRWLGATPSFVSYEGVSPEDVTTGRKGSTHAQRVHGHHGKTIINWQKDDNGEKHDNNNGNGNGNGNGGSHQREGDDPKRVQTGSTGRP